MLDNDVDVNKASTPVIRKKGPITLRTRQMTGERTSGISRTAWDCLGPDRAGRNDCECPRPLDVAAVALFFAGGRA